MIHILYNPKSNCGNNISDSLHKVKQHYSLSQTSLENVLEIKDLKTYFSALEHEDEVVLVGGDGSINILCNQLRGQEIKNNIYLFKAGTGNDFIRDICDGNTDGVEFVLLNDYIRNLPVVTINDKEYLFVNNVGYGIDGRVCTAAEEERDKGKSKINYTTLAIKLLLTSYKPNGATVTVDSKSYRFRNVWMAPVMNGRYYGGGMMPCPTQDRNSDDISCCVIHSTNALQTLMIFPSIFKGEHIKYTKKVEVLKGRHITVEFDKPQDVQIDGETIRGVTKISTVKSPLERTILDEAVSSTT